MQPNSVTPVNVSPLLLSMFAESLECMELLVKVHVPYMLMLCQFFLVL